MPQFFSVETTPENVRVLSLRNEEKEMNVLSEVVLRELNSLIEACEQDTSIKGLVIISGRDDHFIVGADITEIKKFTTAKEAEEGARAMQAIYTRMAKLKISTVAAINGTCLGGGLEMALACTWRIVTDAPNTKLGLPEIQLGLIPGAGGTQRLPRLIGIQAALDMILTGKHIAAGKALKMGLVDAVVPKGQLKQIAIDHALKKRPSSGFLGFGGKDGFSKQLPKLALEGNMLGRSVMRSKAKDMIDEKTKGFYPASYKALSAVFDGFDARMDKGLELEARLFGELAMTRESKSLIHLFDATTAIKKHPYKAAGKEKFGNTKTQLVGVVGSGFMGAGIATVCADKKIRVRLSDPSKDAIGRALQQVKKFFDKKMLRRRLKDFEVTQRMAHISPDISPVGFDQCDIVIEAVFEDLGLKQKILSSLEKDASDNWIFASNTSALPISDIAAVSSKPERVLGMHFFSPVEKMPLLEIVVTEKTAPWATARAVELGQTLGKQVIVVKDSPGFYTTRALAFFLNEAAIILSDGERIETIDKALTDFGFPVGPITLIDEVGIDVGSHVLETMQKAVPQRVSVPAGLKAILDSGRLGRKNQKGFYSYADGKKVGPDPSVYALLKVDPAKADGMSKDEIIDRCLLVFVNESVRCLEEGILPDAYAGDVGAVFGLGFPPFWGGPFKYIDHVGAKVVCERLEALCDKYGARFEPAGLLREHAKAGKTFYS